MAQVKEIKENKMPANRQGSGSFFNFGGTSQRTIAAQAGAKKADGVRDTSTSQKTTQTSEAPPNANAANKGNTQSAYLGLCEALNNFQRKLVEDGVYEVADEYEVVFKPAQLGASTIVPKGSIDQSATPLSNSEDPNKINPERNKSDVSAKTIQVTAGTQVIQLLEQYIRNSSYIQDQALYNNTNESEKPIPTGNSPTGQVAWFKINVDTTPLKYDNIRNDFAYKITYIITPYALNEMQSEWFPKCNFRGLHKSYNYWFTGENTQVLGFEQNLNNLWNLAISGILPKQQEAVPDSRIYLQKSFQPNSEYSEQGAKNNINEPGANAANYLYDAADYQTINLKIIGDPAWLVQGEAGLGVTAAGFNFSAFYPDGTINFDASQVAFNVIWNAPVDYNSAPGSGGLYGGTGLMDTSGGSNASGLSGGARPFQQQNSTWYPITCRSTFNKGRFEQEIDGGIYVLLPRTDGESREDQTITGFSARESQLAREGLVAASTPVAGGNGSWDGETPVANTGDKASSQSPSQASEPKPATSSGQTLPRGQATAAQTLNNIFGNGLNQRNRAANTPSAPQTMAPKDN